VHPNSPIPKVTLTISVVSGPLGLHGVRNAQSFEMLVAQSYEPFPLGVRLRIGALFAALMQLQQKANAFQKLAPDSPVTVVTPAPVLSL
jgi:hypothetical protein